MDSDTKELHIMWLAAIGTWNDNYWKFWNKWLDLFFGFGGMKFSEGTPVDLINQVWKMMGNMK